MKLDAFENMSVKVPFRLGLADTFCCFLFYKFCNRKLAFMNNQNLIKAFILFHSFNTTLILNIEEYIIFFISEFQHKTKLLTIVLLVYSKKNLTKE